ncbi:MAG TPA: MATE family efflux transporter [Thermoplasmata archaeon]|jgi:putative MATE family efflux protein|nr:MATE family efflux transporter [Thermoplasmata archaeon]
MAGATADAPADLVRTSVFRLAWPVMVANLLQTLTTTVDLIMVGHLGAESDAAVGAVGFGAQFIFLFFSVMISVSAGTIALVARAIGAKDFGLADHVLKQSLVLGAFLSIPLTLFGLLFAEPMLQAFGAEPDVVALGGAYIRIISLVVFFQFIGFLGSAALRGAGDTVTPLWIGVLVNVVNFGINVNLIYGNPVVPRLGVPGAAIGTSISYVVGALVLLALFVRGNHRLTLHLSGDWIHMETVRRIFRIGWPAALEQILLQVAFLLWVGMVVVFGTDILAAHQIGLRIQSFAFMPGFGFAIAATALVGQDLGARDPDHAEKSGWEAAKFSVAVMGAIALGIFVFAEPIARAFIGDPVVVAYAILFIRIHAVSIPGVGIFFAIDGALRGAGDTRFPLVTSLSGMYLVRLPLGLLLAFVLGWGVVGVWIPLVVEYYYRTAVITTHFRRGKWKTLRV